MSLSSGNPVEDWDFQCQELEYRSVAAWDATRGGYVGTNINHGHVLGLGYSRPATVRKI